MPEERVLVGRISAAYGLKGWVKVFSYTDPMEQIQSYAPWTLRGPGTAERNVVPERCKRHGKGMIALIDGAGNRDEAEALIGLEILIASDQLPELNKGDYYWRQLEGLLVVNEDDELLGQVDHLMETGSSDVLVIKPTSESIDDVERLIPYVEDEIVKQVNLETGEITVAWQSDY